MFGTPKEKDINAYLAFGKAGGIMEQFFYLSGKISPNELQRNGIKINPDIKAGMLPASDIREDKNGILFSTNREAVKYYVIGLVEGGYLDLLSQFNKYQQNAPYTNDILKWALCAAIIQKNVYLFDEIQKMHRSPIDLEEKVRAYMKDNTALLNQFDTYRDKSSGIIRDIDTQLKNTDQTRYPDKHIVLAEAKKYLSGESNIDKLSQIAHAHPKYDAGAMLSRSHTGKLLDRALELKGDTLIPVAPSNRPK